MGFHSKMNIMFRILYESIIRCIYQHENAMKMRMKETKIKEEEEEEADNDEVNCECCSILVHYFYGKKTCF